MQLTTPWGMFVSALATSFFYNFPDSISAAFRNFDGFPIASFIVKAGENHLALPVAGGNVASGALKSQVAK